MIKAVFVAITCLMAGCSEKSEPRKEIDDPGAPKPAKLSEAAQGVVDGL